MNLKKSLFTFIIVVNFSIMWGIIPDFSGLKVTESAGKILKELESLQAGEWEGFIDSKVKEVKSPEDRFILSLKKAVFLETRGEYGKAAKAFYDAAFAGTSRNDLCLVYAAKNILQEGNYKTAKEYLNPVLLTSRDSTVLSYGRFIYGLATLSENQQEGLKLLKEYLKSPEMTDYEAEILFLLWYTENDKTAAATLKTKFPESPEAQILEGNSQLMASSFWYFMPRNIASNLRAPEEVKTTEKDFFKDKPSNSGSNTVTEETVSSQKRESSGDSKPVVFRQTGFFKNLEYARELQSELREKGFDAKIRETRRQSGNIYYAVIIPENPENQHQIENKLKDLGYESAPLFE